MPEEKEITLDLLLFRVLSVKGYFSSFLVSSILDLTSLSADSDDFLFQFFVFRITTFCHTPISGRTLCVGFRFDREFHLLAQFIVPWEDSCFFGLFLCVYRLSQKTVDCKMQN